MEDKYIKLRQECWDQALFSFGYGYIFSKRAQRYRKYISLINVFGIIVPVTVGATATGYGLNSDFLKYAIILAIPLTILQLLFSVLMIVLKWDDQLGYSYEASKEHGNLSEEFKKIASRPPEKYEELDHQFEIVKTKFSARQEQNSKYNLREKELRKGMRYALREFKRTCYGCKTIPVSMDATDCDICGKF